MVSAVLKMHARTQNDADACSVTHVDRLPASHMLHLHHCHRAPPHEFEALVQEQLSALKATGAAPPVAAATAAATAAPAASTPAAAAPRRPPVARMDPEEREYLVADKQQQLLEDLAQVDSAELAGVLQEGGQALSGSESRVSAGGAGRVWVLGWSVFLVWELQHIQRGRKLPVVLNTQLYCVQQNRCIMDQASYGHSHGDSTKYS